MNKFLYGKIKTKSIYSALLLKYLIAVLFLWFTQWLFIILNWSFFSITSIKEFLSILVGSLRYVVAATTIFLSPFILLCILPFRIRGNKIYQKITNGFFYLGTILLMAVNIIDIVYYRFTFRRMAGDIFNYLSVGGDFKELIPQFAKDFWPYVLIFIILIVLLVWVIKKIQWENKPRQYKYADALAFFVIGAFSIFLCQEGFAFKPLTQNSTVKYTTPPNAPLVVNTPFSIVSTLNGSQLPQSEFNPDKEIEHFFTPVHQPNPRSGEFNENPDMNVVLIILESFSAEYMGCMNEGGESFTPFLDSLAKKSLVFNGMANGKRSIESIPSFVAGLPSVMSDAYITSPYGKNEINSIPSILKKYGYYSAFFHGGYNGSMGFDAFCKHAGYDAYYGMDEYGNRDDYDGKWGIFDEPFLQFMAKEMNSFPKPFHAGVFTISSHHPYTIPEQHKGKFKDGKIPILKPVMYSDYALKCFFDTLSTYDWYDNTLFIISADHTAQPIAPEYGNAYGMYKIPMIFYCPSDTTGERIHKIVQQADVFPTLLDYLNLNEPCIAFGKSAFSTDTNRFHIAYTNGFYQLIRDNYLIFFKEKVEAAYRLSEDPLLNNNLVKNNLSAIYKQEVFLESFIQQYNNRLISNKLILQTTFGDEQ